METSVTSATEPAMTLSELAAYLSVSTQALYDLRSQGRGPRGFRVGRQLRFRLSAIEACLARMEAAESSAEASSPSVTGRCRRHRHAKACAERETFRGRRSTDPQSSSPCTYFAPTGYAHRGQGAKGPALGSTSAPSLVPFAPSRGAQAEEGTWRSTPQER